MTKPERVPIKFRPVAPISLNSGNDNVPFSLARIAATTGTGILAMETDNTAGRQLVEEPTVTVLIQQPVRPRKASRRGPVAALALAGGGALLVGTGAFSSWDATTSVSSGALTAGSGAATILDANGGTFTTGVSNLLPGDYFFRYVDVRNDGTQASTFTGAVSASGDLAGQLGVDVVTCSVPWATVAGASTCAGTTSPSIGSGTPTTATPVAVAHGTIATGAAAAQHVRYKFTFSNTAPTTMQGKTGTVTIAVNNTVVGGTDRTTG